MQRVGRTGSTAPAKIGGYRRPLLDGQEALLRELTSAEPGITLVEIKRALAERGIEAVIPRRSGPRCAGSVCRTKKSLKAAEQDRPDVARSRRGWRLWQRYMDPSALCSWTRRAPART